MRVQVACAPNALRLPPHRALRITKRSTMPLPLPMTAFSHQSTPRPVLATQGIATQALGLLAEVSSPLSFSLPLAVPLVALGCAALLAWVDARSRIALPAVQLPQQQPPTPAPDLEAGNARQAAKTAEGGASGGMSSSSSNGCSALSQQFHQEVLSRCPTIMERPYRPVPFLTNRHALALFNLFCWLAAVETIFASRFRRTPPIVYRREILHMHDGGSVALDWELDSSCALELPGNAPILILLAGLTGGSSDSYVVYAVQRAREAGIRAVVFNSRGTADSPVTSPQYYSASFTGDLREVVAHVQQRHPDSLLLAAGWSLGANILVRYLGEEGNATPLKAAVSMCNPFDMTISNANLRRGFNKIYDINLGNGLRRIHSKHLLLWNGIQHSPSTSPHWLQPPFRPDLAARCRNIREFDEALTIHSFGWPTVEAYYAGSSSSDSIPQVAIPLLCIQALDDPIAPAEAIPYQCSLHDYAALNTTLSIPIPLSALPPALPPAKPHRLPSYPQALSRNPHTLLVTTTSGGHLGWVSGDQGPLGHPWSDQAMMEWLVSVTRTLGYTKGGSGPGPGPATPTAVAPSVQQQRQRAAQVVTTDAVGAHLLSQAMPPALAAEAWGGKREEEGEREAEEASQLKAQAAGQIYGMKVAGSLVQGMEVEGGEEADYSLLQSMPLTAATLDALAAAPNLSLSNRHTQSPTIPFNPPREGAQHGTQPCSSAQLSASLPASHLSRSQQERLERQAARAAIATHTEPVGPPGLLGQTLQMSHDEREAPRACEGPWSNLDAPQEHQELPVSPAFKAVFGAVMAGEAQSAAEGNAQLREPARIAEAVVTTAVYDSEQVSSATDGSVAGTQGQKGEDSGTPTSQGLLSFLRPNASADSPGKRRSSESITVPAEAVRFAF
ncbi:hypothetical protein QJQ45_000448 [Haematococcus lacustris]|nr:hypothetical protein QJQ45_000448 [Haematococcus lacustris]